MDNTDENLLKTFLHFATMFKVGDLKQISQSDGEFKVSYQEIDPGMDPPFNRKLLVAKLDLIPGQYYDIQIGFDKTYDGNFITNNNQHIVEQVQFRARKGLKPLPAKGNVQSVRHVFDVAYSKLIHYIVFHHATRLGFQFPEPIPRFIDNIPRDFPRPTFLEKSTEEVYRHYAYAFRTEHYLEKSTPNTLKKFYKQRLPADGFTFKDLGENLSILYNQMGYYDKLVNERVPVVKNSYDFVRVLLNTKITMSKAGGISVPQVLNGHKSMGINYRPYEEEFKPSDLLNKKGGHSIFHFMYGEDGIARTVSGTKGHFIVITIYYIQYLLDSYSLEELKPNMLFLIAPCIYNGVEKFEGLKGYDDPEKCRMIFVAPLLTYLIEHVEYVPFARFVKKNLPFFHGYDWSRGGANDIMEVLSRPLEYFHQKALELNLIDEYEKGVDAYCWDIASQDKSFCPDMLCYFQYMTLGLHLITLYDEISPYSKDEIIELVKQGKIDEVKHKINSAFREHEDFDAKWESLRYYCLNVNSTPVVNYSSVAAVFQFYRYEMSGSQMTSSNNTTECSLVPIMATRMLLTRCKEDLLCPPNIRKLAIMWALLIRDYPNHVAMGDNGFCLFPKILRPYLFEKGFDPLHGKNPLTHSLFNEALNSFGAELKPSESYAVFDWQPRFVGSHADRKKWEPSPITNGRGDVPSFCQRFFFLMEPPPEIDFTTRAFNLNIRAAFVPWRYPSDYFSKVSPFAQHDTLLIYYIKVCSLIGDNCGIDKRTHYFLFRLARSVRAFLNSRAPDLTEQLRFFLEKLDADSLTTFLTRHTGMYDLSHRDAQEMLPNVGHIPNLSDLHRNLFFRSRISAEVNFDHKFADIRNKKDKLDVDVETRDLLLFLKAKYCPDVDHTKHFALSRT